MLKYSAILVAALLSLSACTEVTQSANRAYDSTRAGIYNSAEKVQELMQYNPPPTAPQPAQTRYCYKSMADIICYESPQSHISNQLVGYQGTPPQSFPAPGQPYPVAAYQQQHSAPMIAQDGTEVTPFYGHQDSYVQPSGQRVESVRAVSRNGEIIMGDVPPPTPQTGAPASVPTAQAVPVPTPNAPAGDPRSLMPRY